MASKATAAPIANNWQYVAKLTVTDSVEVTVGLSAKDRDNLLYDLIQTLPSDNHIRKYLHI